jgi:hypothetical protein
VLENHSQGAGGDTFAAVDTFFFIDNIGAGIILRDGVFRAGLGAFAALGADNRAIFSRIGKLCFDAQSRFLRIYLAEVVNRADLPAEAAAGAVILIYFYSHFNLLREIFIFCFEIRFLFFKRLYCTKNHAVIQPPLTGAPRGALLFFELCI